MKATQLKYLYYSIIVVSLLIILFSVYYQLGGFREMEVNAFEGADYAIAGKEFKGTYNDPQIEELYNSVKEKISTGEIKGILSLIDYTGTDSESNEVHYFIGILLLNKVTELPVDYRVRKIKSRGILGVHLDVHPIVRPPKDDIESKIIAAAREHDLQLEDYFLEKHFADDRMVVEGFVQ